MDDLLENFANRSLRSPSEEGYKYHFVNGSPVGSEHAMPIGPSAPAPVVSNNEASNIQKQTGPAVENEADYNFEDETDYNADVDDDSDEYGHKGATHEADHADYTGDPTNRASYKKAPLSENDNTYLDRFFHNQDMHSVDGRSAYGSIVPSPALSDDGQDRLDGFAQHLRRLHRQDMERDELLTQLHQENLDLKRALKDFVPGGNPRAEAAERSLFEIRKSINTGPYVCVLIDGKGYKIHEDLLQSGKTGGIEAAYRMGTEISNLLQQFGDAKSWRIMVHLYIDIEGLLARCVSADIPLSDGNVRDFMIGFTQAQSLFTIVDVGYDSEKLSRKMEDTFHLFVNNVQCKHLIFGCCHNSAYTVALEPYASNPITASRITLLKSYEDNTCFEGLPFTSVEFPHVFRSTPFKETDRLAEDVDYMQDFPQQSGSGGFTRELEKPSAEVTGEGEALPKWQATSNASIPLPTGHSQPTNPRSTWGSNQTVLLNINDERVDPPPLEEDYETSESMKDRMEVRRFCSFYHLQGKCVSHNPTSQQVCKFRHGPKLNPREKVVLRNYAKKLPCGRGSTCRQSDCVFGHNCHDQPGCTLGARCLLYKFHDVDPTVVRVWPSQANTSPRQR